jgi:cysteine-rich repeat protein
MKKEAILLLTSLIILSSILPITSGLELTLELDEGEELGLKQIPWTSVFDAYLTQNDEPLKLTIPLSNTWDDGNGNPWTSKEWKKKDYFNFTSRSPYVSYEGLWIVDAKVTVDREGKSFEWKIILDAERGSYQPNDYNKDRLYVLKNDESGETGFSGSCDGISESVIFKRYEGNTWFSAKGKATIKVDGLCDEDEEEDEEKPTSICGDGEKEGEEECDDGNKKDGDGCSSECTEETIESVQVGFEPNYYKETSKSISGGGRGFKPEKITPYDDIICVAKVYSAKPLAIEGNLVTGGGEGPSSKTYELSLLKKDITDIKIINKGKEDEHFIYTWKIPGWDKGWSSNLQAMAILTHNEMAECRINFKDNPKNMKSKKFPVTSCVHLYGKNDAKFKFVDMYGKSTGKVHQYIIDRSKKNFNDGIRKIEPFKSNYLEFAQFADIKRHDDTKWKTSGNYISSFSSSKARRVSSCGKQFTNYAFYTNRIHAGGYTNGWGNGEMYISTQTVQIYIDTQLVGGDSEEYDRQQLGTAFHELGHAFGGVLDEYLYKKATSTWEGEKNCVSDPAKFGKYQYGDFIGCYTMPKNSYPSPTSIMRYSASELRFNVISCGYIMKEILGKEIDLPTAFGKCSDMDVMKEGACSLVYDCNQDRSEGCYECIKGQCQFTKVNNYCKHQSSKTFEWTFGKCNSPGTFRDPICGINPRWECNEDRNCRKGNLCKITRPGTADEMHVCVSK